MSSSTVGMDNSFTTVTVHGALPTGDPFRPGARNNTRQVTPIGTASDGSETTYLDEVVIYGSGSSTARSSGASRSQSASTTSVADLTPISTWRATLVEGASAYAVAISHPSNSPGTAFSCNFDSEECVQSNYRVFTSTISATATTTFTSASLTRTLSHVSAINSPIATLLVSLPTAAPTSSVPTPSSSLIPSSDSGSSNASMVGRAVGGAIGGSVLLALICFLLIFCSRRYRRRRSADRSLPQNFSRSPPPDDRVARSHPPSSTIRRPQPAYGNMDNASETYSESELKNPNPRPNSIISASGSASDSRSVLSDSPYNRIPSVPYASSQTGASPYPYNEEKGSMTALALKRSFPPNSPSPLTRNIVVDDVEKQASPDPFPTNAPSISPAPRPQRNNSSRFIERLSLNSTKLDVLMTLASIESARNSGSNATDKTTSAVVAGETDSNSHSRLNQLCRTSLGEDASNLDDSTTLQGSSYGQESTLASAAQSWEDSSTFPHPGSSLSHSHSAHHDPSYS